MLKDEDRKTRVEHARERLGKWICKDQGMQDSAVGLKDQPLAKPEAKESGGDAPGKRDSNSAADDRPATTETRVATHTRTQGTKRRSRDSRTPDVTDAKRGRTDDQRDDIHANGEDIDDADGDAEVDNGVSDEDDPSSSSSSSSSSSCFSSSTGGSDGNDGARDSEGDVGMASSSPYIERNIVTGIICRVDLTEMYSPARVARVCAKFVLIPGTSFGLLTGWDFDKAEDRRAAFKTVMDEAPEVLIGCPPCTLFSTLQDLARAKHGHRDGWLEGRELLYQKACRHLEVCAKLYNFHISRGRFFVHAHPWSASAWQIPCIHEIRDTGSHANPEPPVYVWIENAC